MQPIPKRTDDTRLILLRTLRSSRKRFHVRPLLVVGRLDGMCPAAMVESWRTNRNGNRRTYAVVVVFGRIEEENELGRVVDRDLRWMDLRTFGDLCRASRFTIRHDASLGSDGWSMVSDADGEELSSCGPSQLSLFSQMLRFDAGVRSLRSEILAAASARHQGSKAFLVQAAGSNSH
jgi:hypothetical protein